MAVKAEIVRGVDNYSIEKLDNGFTLSYSGYDKSDQWVSKKVVIVNEKELIDTIKVVNAILAS